MINPIVSYMQNGKPSAFDTIRWSTEAAVMLGDAFYSAFPRDSYLALVDFDARSSEESVVIVLPKGARRLGFESFVNRVHDAAVTARSNDVRVAMLESVPQGTWGAS